jgi:hypothetical protein
MTMYTRMRMMAVAIGVLAVAATMAQAHHSQSQFESTETKVIEGTLTRASWRNPHSLFVVQGKVLNGSGADEEWLVEGPSPAQLTRGGWTNEVSKVGDKVTFTGRPRRDGKPELLLLKVTLADGKTFSFIPD